MLNPPHPKSVSGWTMAVGMQPLEREMKQQKRKMKEELMLKLMLETACTVLAYWHVRC